MTEFEKPKASEQLRVTITGPIAAGKTVLARKITEWLREAGYDVDKYTVRTRSSLTEKEIIDVTRTGKTG